MDKPNQAEKPPEKDPYPPATYAPQMEYDYQAAHAQAHAHYQFQLAQMQMHMMQMGMTPYMGMPYSPEQMVYNQPPQQPQLQRSYNLPPSPLTMEKHKKQIEEYQLVDSSFSAKGNRAGGGVRGFSASQQRSLDDSTVRSVFTERLQRRDEKDGEIGEEGAPDQRLDEDGGGVGMEKEVEEKYVPRHRRLQNNSSSNKEGNGEDFGDVKPNYTTLTGSQMRTATPQLPDSHSRSSLPRPQGPPRYQNQNQNHQSHNNQQQRQGNQVNQSIFRQRSFVNRTQQQYQRIPGMINVPQRTHSTIRHGSAGGKFYGSDGGSKFLDRLHGTVPTHCTYCQMMMMDPEIYTSHNLYCEGGKKVNCKRFKKYGCRLCWKSGEEAHPHIVCPLWKSEDPSFEKFAEEFDIEKWDEKKKSSHQHHKSDSKRQGIQKQSDQHHETDSKRQGNEKKSSQQHRKPV